MRRSLQWQGPQVGEGQSGTPQRRLSGEDEAFPHERRHLHLDQLGRCQRWSMWRRMRASSPPVAVSAEAGWVGYRIDVVTVPE